MEQVLTLVVRLQVDINQQQSLANTANAFASACNWINQNVNPNLTNRNSIQAVCYKEVKNQFGLTANHVVRACARVGANRLTAKQKAVRPRADERRKGTRTKTGKKVKYFQPTSFDCDARTFRFIEVIAVNPAYTSQTCYCCLHIGLRSNKSFKCSNTSRCGWIGDADENGSKMIALVGLSVNQPRGSQLLACPITEGLPKAPA